jgi:hypothetical protein
LKFIKEVFTAPDYVGNSTKSGAVSCKTKPNGKSHSDLQEKEKLDKVTKVSHI